MSTDSISGVASAPKAAVIFHTGSSRTPSLFKNFRSAHFSSMENSRMSPYSPTPDGIAFD